MSVLFSQALAIAVVAYVYAEVLTEPGEMLHWWKTLLRSVLMEATDYRDLQGYRDEREVFAPNGRKLEDFEFLYKPLIDCTKCVAGQLALWWYLITSLVFDYQEYRLDYHIVLICSSILLTIILNNVHEWMKRKM